MAQPSATAVLGVLLKKIDHIGIAVPKLDEAVKLYTAISGHAPEHFEEVADQKVKTAFFSVGESNLELLEATAPDSPIAKYIEKQGRGGIHHICVAVDDVAKKLVELKAAGIILIDEKPRRGAHNKLVAFVHPKSTGGVLIELSQECHEL
jgi:methylmalonyl-CoA/ethylmalonyl-CoA epimerase